MNIEILEEHKQTVQSSIDRLKFEFKKQLSTQEKRIEALENMLSIKENVNSIKVLESQVQEYQNYNPSLQVAKNEQNNEITSLNNRQKQLFDFMQKSELIVKAQKPFSLCDAENLLKIDIDKIQKEISCIKENVLKRQVTNEEFEQIIYKLEQQCLTKDEFKNSIDSLIDQKIKNINQAPPKFSPQPCFNNPSNFKIQPNKFQTYADPSNSQKIIQPCAPQQLFFPQQNHQEKQKQNVTIMETQKQQQ